MEPKLTSLMNEELNSRTANTRNEARLGIRTWGFRKEDSKNF